MNTHRTSLKLATLMLSVAPWLVAAPRAEAQELPKTEELPKAPEVPPAPSKAETQDRAAHAKAAPEPPRTAKAPRKPAAPQKTDHMELGTTTVTGNRELPKVMYIVPWKKSDIGDIGGKPMNSLLDEVLAPVDRDVFRREVGYYGALTSGAPQNGAAAPPAPQGEK